MKHIRRLADAAIDQYNRMVLNHPVLVIVVLVIGIGLLGYKSLDFKIDASTETLLLENDKDLQYTRQVSKRYGVNDFLVISYTPKSGDLLDRKNLEHLIRLRDELKQLPLTDSVHTIADVPLLQSPPIDYTRFSGTLPNLESPNVDRALARSELQQSAFYRDLIVSGDMKTTALQVNLKGDATFRDLIEQRSAIREKGRQGPLSPEDQRRLGEVQARITQRLDLNRKATHENIAMVRATMDRYRDSANLFLGGITMIADDMITFIRNDLKVFGVGVFILLVGMLGLIFRHLRWIILPMLCCFLSVIAMMGVLALFGWEVTVISSNFISLQLIITLAIAVHLIVRYREYQETRPEMDQHSLVKNTIRTKFVPCLYAVLTTIAGFSSLLLSNIKPVINFGWMMSAGITFSLVLTFVLFPAAMVLMKKPKVRTNPEGKNRDLSLTPALARFTQAHGKLILAVTLVVTALTVMGASRLVVENSFIDYFKKSTEIYQGMKIIDEKLGGTTPLDIIVQFEPIELDNEDKDDFEEEDPFAEELAVKEDTDKYWFLDSRMRTVEKVHDYLDNLPETGKVLSLGTLLKIGRKLNRGRTLDSIEMAVLYTKLPDEFKKMILSPYLSIENNEVRYSVRIKDSMKGLKRNALLKQIKDDLTGKLGLPENKVHLAGAMVLYNNMLQSLFSSQIKTLGVVALALLAMFLVLFRSLKVALIALYPNLLSAGAVLGVMGWMNIPLDMMTITIAAISIGIAVDNTIHYIYRFREEIETGHGYMETLHRCHSSIGYAMYYTSIIIIIGFSILVFSNFLPTIYFGLFTGLAMLIAMIAALTLLPQLLIVFKPFKCR
ncbi:MAG: MMPL family transporter [Desulfobacteraceae bacterium]